MRRERLPFLLLLLIISLQIIPHYSWLFLPGRMRESRVKYEVFNNNNFHAKHSAIRAINDESQDEPKKSTKRMNIDLFAVGERQHRDKSRSQISDRLYTNGNESLPFKFFQQQTNDSASTSSTEKLTAFIPQVERLRLEAERESLLVEQDRLLERQEALKSVDRLLLSLLESVAFAPVRPFSLSEFVSNHKQHLSKELLLRLIELANNEFNILEKNRLYQLHEDLLQEVSKQDPNQHSEIVAALQKEINQELFVPSPPPSLDRDGASQKPSLKSYDEVLQSWLTQLQNSTTLSGGNNSLVNLGNFSSVNNMIDSRVFRLPLALPLEYVATLMKAPTLTEEEQQTLREGVFVGELFEDIYEADISPVISVYRGSPSRSYHETLSELERRLKQFPALDEKVQIVLYPEYKPVVAPIPEKRMKKERFGVSTFEPVFIVLSKDVKPLERSKFESVGAIASTFLAVVTSFFFAIGVYSSNSDFFDRALRGDPSILSQLWPLTGGVLLLQLFHDLAHVVVARSRGVTLGFPSLLVPSLQIGVYGSVTRFLSFVKNRRDLFDISIAGPLVGFLGSLICSVGGLLLTASASPDFVSSFPQLPQSFFQASTLFSALVHQFLPPSVSAARAIAVHPLVMVGYAGLVANALNFLPIGKLDGGRVLMSIIGRRSTSLITILFLLSQGIWLLFLLEPSSNLNMIVPFWLITVAFLQRNVDLPPQDDVTPITSFSASSTSANASYWMRLVSVALCTFLTIGALLPVIGGDVGALPPLPPTI